MNEEQEVRSTPVIERSDIAIDVSNADNGFIVVLKHLDENGQLITQKLVADNKKFVGNILRAFSNNVLVDPAKEAVDQSKTKGKENE